MITFITGHIHRLERLFSTIIPCPCVLNELWCVRGLLCEGVCMCVCERVQHTVDSAMMIFKSSPHFKGFGSLLQNAK